MNENAMLDWLLDNGGPAVRLRVAAELGNASGDAFECDAEELAGIPAVQQILSYLDPYRTLDIANLSRKQTHDLIHCFRDTSLEKYFPRLLALGFRAGMPALDDKMQYLRTAFPFIAREPIYGWVICEMFFKAGYAHPEMVAHMLQRLDALQPAAEEQAVDVYFKEPELRGLPGQWKGKHILRHEYNPYGSSKPLPTVHDLAAFAYFPPAGLVDETRRKIETLVRYILLPEFQQLPEGYGFIWYPERRVCLASGWSPTIPLFQGCERTENYNNWYFLIYLEMLSRLPLAHSSEWFQTSLERIEQYRTKNGTYLLPEAYLHQKYIEQAWLSKAGQSLKRSEKKALAQELAGTLLVWQIKRRVKALTPPDRQ